eukprot:CAMPEP_0201545802 /NCGR_PEP_ID=MMETSP0173_2-20130828/2227_1 /ASSEMBLY_ACC=CAM_ASM_000268 /TAXON_ID=218659 /ORGANISM="Vexillifera sp., Strain DIVA3 564/2" /LENGTH=552 /DNA_ID=CAMNT_0047954307 /DNA_START=24 /DNA_END=1678 /DNA_ORIENTATION=-
MPVYSNSAIQQRLKAASKDNGGVPCVVCTVLSQMFIVKLERENVTIDQALSSFCSYLPVPLNKYCTSYLSKNGEKIIDAFFNYEAPDRICYALGACTNPQQCRLYPSSLPITEDFGSFFLEDTFPVDFENSIENWLEWIVKRFGDDHLPLDDIDNDYFSPAWKTLRGRDWRGRDCNDLDHLVYPGTIPSSGDRMFDSNCNGIYGINNVTGKPYEHELCNVEQRGVGLIGDSVGAHFAFPCTFYFPGPGVYDHFLYFAANEGDWPFTSHITGFRNDTTGLLDPDRKHPLPLDSIYLRMLERNRCVYNDFQNLAVNGADSVLSVHNLHALARNQKRDQPMLFFQMLIGDDICDSKDGKWTPPDKYEQAMLQNLDYLDQHLPKGSFVVNVGIIDGSVIYDVLHNQSYPFSPEPLQSANNVASYKEWWEFMICTRTVVCYGWMTPNATVRREATQHAFMLNDILKNITHTRSYNNFDMAYYDFPFVEMGIKIREQGLPFTALFEPFLGLHTTQHAVSILAGVLYNKIERDYGDKAFGPINPNNQKIVQLFSQNQNP